MTDFQPEPRPSAEIFADLRSLATSDGAVHGISEIIFRDWVYTIDTQERTVVDDPEHRWSTSRLNKPELMLLLGLAVQSQSDRTHTVLGDASVFMSEADRLLRELHDRVMIDVKSTLPANLLEVENPLDVVGLMAREAIYYAAESFYLHQFPPFIRQRYRRDGDWLLRNKGISILPMIEIARFISDKINRQMSVVGHLRKSGTALNSSDLTNSLMIPLADLRQKFKGKADAFDRLFAIDVTSTNLGFTDPFAMNETMIYPIVRIGDFLYVPNQYRLFETLYESPFYWMLRDENYMEIAKTNRGTFLEATAAHILRSVFGPENVHENVTLYNGTKDKAGEIDILVTYGEFVLVVQAKSKRITMQARAGDKAALRRDFRDAIQAPYGQALTCARLIRMGATCVRPDGTKIDVRRVNRLFPMVVLSDHFPAVTMLARSLLEREKQIAPVIWDLGVLDCAARLFPNPIDMIFYLKSRSDLYDQVMSESEHCFIGFHLTHKLALPDEFQGLAIDRDYAQPVDDFMMPFDVGVEGIRPKGILERLDVPIVTDLLRELRSKGPEIAAVVVDLYDLSSEMLRDIAAHITQLRQEVAAGKALKAFSIPTTAGGLTYVVVDHLSEKSRAAASSIGRKHKYDTKSSHWYVIVDCIQTGNPIDELGCLVWEWQEDHEEQRLADQVSGLFRSSRSVIQVGDASKALAEKARDAST
ncbi:NERD domain-containing protein [Rhodobacter capsulatus]|uniref:NERD domain-containing protein n=1 Tax=Rhodobacter capsulatus TaxID=1061 RepID=UPI0003D3284E|nr:NERD domain-containing protein [Rhodobacter capsulatus]ETD90457.1 hypothetical protein U713_05620 [Rhodobacter capsulatus YW2]